MKLVLLLLLGQASPAIEPGTWSTAAPLIQQHCAACHREGGSAPFTLLTHADVKRRRSFIATVLKQELMPPWLPSNKGVALQGDGSMPPEDRASLIAWLEAGAPVGSEQNPAPIKPMASATFPTDSIKVTMTEPFTIPAETIETEQRYHEDTWTFVMPVGNETPLRIRGIGWEPTAPETVHTITLLFDAEGRGRQRDEYDPRPGYEMSGDLNRDISGTNGGVGIGMNRMLLPESFHWSLPADADLVADVRYRPIGREMPLQDSFHLFPTEDEDSREIIAVLTAVNRLKVPAGETQHIAEDRFTLPAAMDVVAILPRSRNECRSMQLMAILPDGETRVLMDIPGWDGHFRRPFLLEEVLHLPEGTTLHSRFVIDNSTENPRNPFDPPEDFRIGKRTGAAAFTLLGAGTDEEGSAALVELSQWTMDRRGSRTRKP
ncbi:MAG: hypothetical protein CMJ36_03085 [Phycisphaerae bacterium]|nr:hypothetical protein [Phycisphaerae bacterium]